MTLDNLRFCRALVLYFQRLKRLGLVDGDLLLASVERHEKRLTICASKASYVTRGLAKAALRANRHGQAMAYECPNCGDFHITTRSQHRPLRTIGDDEDA